MFYYKLFYFLFENVHSSLNIYFNFQYIVVKEKKWKEKKKERKRKKPIYYIWTWVIEETTELKRIRSERGFEQSSGPEIESWWARCHL